MKNGIRKAIAMMLILMVALSATGYAAKLTPSKGFKLPAVKVRPTAEPEATPAPEAPETEEPAAPEGDAAEGIAYVVLEDAEDILNIRAAASIDSEKISYVHHGATVTVLEVEGEWTKIRAANGDVGYVSSIYLSAEAPAQPEAPVEPEAPEVEEPEAPAATELPVLKEELVPVEEEKEEVVKEETEEEVVLAYTFVRDENGELVIDEETGNPIAIIPEGMEVPIDYVRDENGNLVLDENGDPIVLNTVPEGADKITTIVDELNPDRYVDIYAVWQDETPELNEELTLVSVAYGYEEIEYTYQWQRSADDVNWTDIEGATEARYTFTVTEENYRDFWRVTILITGIIGEEA